MSLNLINILRSGLGNLSLLAPREAPPGSCFSPSHRRRLYWAPATEAATAGSSWRAETNQLWMKVQVTQSEALRAHPGLHNL